MSGENSTPTGEDAALIPPDPTATTTDLGALDTQRILRETGSIPLPPEPEENPDLAHEDDAAPDSIDVAASQERPPRSGVNILALISLALGVTASPFTVIFGYLAVRQARRAHQRGETLAWISVGLGWLWVVAYTVLGSIVFVAWQQVS